MKVMDVGGRAVRRSVAQNEATHSCEAHDIEAVVSSGRIENFSLRHTFKSNRNKVNWDSDVIYARVNCY